METHNVGSIYDLPPLEQGGTRNRQGIDFQDHVAADFCLDMLLGDELAEVWCETQDDITLIWYKSGNPEVEFVQVKSNRFNRLWSVSILCDREGKGPGHSILEKSLANDRCAEKCCFRMVTAFEVNNELEILTYPINSSHRLASTELLETLIEEARKKVSDYTSANGQDVSFWISNTTWDIRYTKEAVQDKAILKLRQVLENESIFLATDQVGEVYSRLLNKVWEAGLGDYRINPATKRITRSDLIAWFKKVVDETIHPAASGAVSKMQKKMEAAGIPADTIETAKEARRYYREEVLKPKYLNLTDRHLMEGEVLSRLLRLKSQLDAGTTTQVGVEFHELCLEKLEEIQEALPFKAKVPLIILQGSMYETVNRCLHRFGRAA